MSHQPDPTQPQPAPGAEPETEDVEAASLVANSTFTLAARVYGTVAAAVIAVLTVRVLSVTEYGRYALAMAVVLIVGSLAELGMSALVIRKLAADPGSSARVVGVALLAETCTALVGAAVMVPLGLALGYSSQVIALLAIGCGVILSQGLLAVLNGAFQARRVFVLFALTNVVQTTVLLVGSVAVLLAGAGPAGLLVVAVAAYVVAAGTAYALLRRRLRVTPVLAGAAGGVPSFLREAVPIAATAGIAVLYGRIDVLLLAQLASEDAVAIYNLPLTIVELTLLVPAAIGVAFYPLMTKQIEHGTGEATESLDLLFRLFLFGSIPLALVLGVGGSDLLGAVFGSDYEASGDVLAWLAPAVVCNFMVYLFWYALLAGHKERGRIPAVITGLVVNVLLNLWMIPRHGAAGAAAALAATDVLMAVWLGVVVRRGVVAAPLLRRCALPAVALVAAAAVVLAPVDVPALARGLAAAAVYLAVLLGARYIRPPEWEPFLGPVRGRVQSLTNR